MRRASLAMLAISISSFALWLANSTGFANPTWLAVNAVSLIAFVLLQVLVCGTECPECGRMFHIADDGQFLTWRGFIGPTRCVHCAVELKTPSE